MEKSVLQKILKYRGELMGLAILWVMLYHTNIETGIGFLNGMKLAGYGGVDIFLFVSGMGIYYSLKKNDLKKYAVNRLRRIYPVYIPVVIVYMLVFEQETLRLSHVLGNVTGLGFAFSVENQPYWYASLIIILYILAPYLYTFITAEGKRPALRCILLLAGAGVVSLIWLERYEMLAAARLPVFVLGMIAAYYIDRGESPRVKDGWLLAVSAVLLTVGTIILYIGHRDWLNIMWVTGLYWYPFFLVAPSACVILSYIFGKAAACRWLFFLRLPRKCLALIGGASWEIYLIHVPVFQRVVYRHMEFSILKWVLLSIPCIVAGILWHYLVDRLMKRLSGKQSPKA